MKNSLDKTKYATDQEDEGSTTQIKNQKLIGYILRMLAVFSWGLSPIIIKYNLSNIDGIFITGFSIFCGLVFLVPFTFFIKFFFKKTQIEKQNIKKGYTKSFWIAVIFDGLTVLFFYFSVHFTIASNAALFFNFAPVLGLVITLAFFKEKIPYFRTKGNVSNIIFIFLTGCIGTSLLIVNKADANVIDFQSKLFGDSLSLIALFCDVVATLALINYAKSKTAFSGLDFIVRKITVLAIVFSPVVIPRLFSLELTQKEWFSFIFLGVVCFVLSYFFAYEAYKRIEGLIAYLMFNLTAVVTIFIEVIFFGLEMTWIFVAGSFLIIISAISAEIINSKNERKTKQPGKVDISLITE